MSQLTLDEHLNEMTVDTLKVFARRLEISKTITRKRAMGYILPQ